MRERKLDFTNLQDAIARAYFLKNGSLGVKRVIPRARTRASMQTAWTFVHRFAAREVLQHRACGVM